VITSLFAGFNHAVRSMQHAQYALGIHSSNVAHANDPNYTRRQLQAPSDTGVDRPGIVRLRSAFVDDQYRLANGLLGEAEVRKDVLSKVEDIFGDPVEGGMRKSIDQFFDAWQGLAENPGDGVVRSQVLIAGRSLADQISTTYNKLSAVEATVGEQLPARVNEVNDKLAQVFTLNKHIADAKRQNLDDAEMRDQRDKLLDDLAGLTGATSIEDGDGTVRVIVGSAMVLEGPTVVKLTLATPAGGKPMPVWQGFGAFAPGYDGKGAISGLVTVRDVELRQLKQEITSLADEIAQAVNAQHAAGIGLDGSTGNAFFIGTPPGIKVNNLNVDQIAAGGAGGTGLPSDGRNARLLTAIGETPAVPSVVMPGQLESPRVFYRNLVGWVGSQTKETNLAAEVAQSHLDVSGQQRQSQWGVSMDEEVANLSLQQKAFQASARVITIMDDMLDTLINRTGR